MALIIIVSIDVGSFSFIKRYWLKTKQQSINETNCSLINFPEYKVWFSKIDLDHIKPIYFSEVGGGGIGLSSDSVLKFNIF